METRKPQLGEGVTVQPLDVGLEISADAGALPPVRLPKRISTVSHTLAADLAEQLRQFAFRERISESAVIEQGLRDLFDGGQDASLGARLRLAGATLRRKI